MGQRQLDDPSAKGELYARQVVSGEIPACRLVQKACQRQLDDLERWKRGESSWEWEPERGNSVCRFIENLPHVKGRWKTRNIELEPWQCFLITVLFGWVDKEGFRRFRTAYIEVPRKNAKTTLCAGIALFMLCADAEPGPEVYSAAVTRDQAKISWEIAQRMVKADAEMQEFYGVEALAHSIVREIDGGSFKPLARDADSLEGLSPHCVIVDELHAHKTREVWDVLNVARGSRRQSLLLAITTAGNNKAGVCYEQHGYVEQILSGRLQEDIGADRYFGIIYTIDPEDDWTTQAAAKKANPNYGVSVLPDDIEALCSQAQSSAESQNTYLNKRTNVWTTVGTAYFNMLAWERLCQLDERSEYVKVLDNGRVVLNTDKLAGSQCMITLDLASKRDLTAKIRLFRIGPNYYVSGRYYLPEDAMEPGKPNYDLYRGWSKDPKANLSLTPGNVTDYDFVERDVLVDVKYFKPRRVGVDPNYNAGQLTTRMLDAGVPMVDVAHNVPNFSEPMKHLDALIIAGRIKHDGDPILSWAIGNVMAKKDVKDNVYPRKARDEDKIDPAVALIANLSLWLRIVAKPSAYANAKSIVI